MLYGYLGVEQARGLLSWSFAAQRIYKAAKEQGYRYDSSAPQLLPLTLVVGHEGKILFTHSGRSQTDLPEDCTAIREIAHEVVHTMAEDQKRAHPHCSDETLTLPDLVGWNDENPEQKAPALQVPFVQPSDESSSENSPGMPQMAAMPTSVNTMRDQMDALPPSSQPTKSNWNRPTRPQLMPPTIMKIRQIL